MHAQRKERVSSAIIVDRRSMMWRASIYPMAGALDTGPGCQFRPIVAKLSPRRSNHKAAALCFWVAARGLWMDVAGAYCHSRRRRRRLSIGPHRILSQYPSPVTITVERGSLRAHQPTHPQTHRRPNHGQEAATAEATGGGVGVVIG